MFGRMKQDLQSELQAIKEAGLFKEERQITSAQAADIRVVYPEGKPAKPVINFCANNYLGLSSHPKVIEAARDALADYPGRDDDPPELRARSPWRRNHRGATRRRDNWPTI